MLTAEFEATILKLRHLIETTSSLSDQDLSRLSEIGPVEELVKLEINENFTIESDSTLHYTISNKKIKSILRNGSETLLPISSAISLYGQSIIKFQNNFIAVGGSSPAGLTSKSVLFFDSKGKIFNIFELKKPRKFSTILEIDGNFFIIGGIARDGTALNMIEVYDSDMNRLSKIKMKNGRSYPCACAFNGFLYVCSKETQYVEKYSLDEFKFVANVKIKTDSGIDFIVAFKESLLVFTGKKYFVVNKNDNVVRSYDTDYEYTWTQSQIGTYENGIYFSDYFSLKLNVIEIILPA